MWLNQQSSWGDQHWNITLDGSYRVNGTSIRFEDFSIGSACSGGHGGLHIRDANGYWLNLPFPEDCSGCPEAIYNHQSQGNICLDLSEYFAVEYQSLRLSQ